MLARSRSAVHMITNANKSKMPKKKTTTETKSKTSELKSMPTRNEAITCTKTGIAVKILAKPGAKQNTITGIGEEGVGIQIAAPPMEGEANTELIKYLSKLLQIRKSDIYLDKGSRSRNKIVVISLESGITTETVHERILQEINT